MRRLLVVGSIDGDTGAVSLQPLIVVPDADEVKPRVPGPCAIVLMGKRGQATFRRLEGRKIEEFDVEK